MSGNQAGIAVGIGVQVVEKGILHLIVPLLVGQRVIGFAMPEKKV
jgi:hypothetical protein